jgi:hypothetical protein
VDIAVLTDVTPCSLVDSCRSLQDGSARGVEVKGSVIIDEGAQGLGPCRPVHRYQRFGRTLCLHLDGKGAVKEDGVVPSSKRW